MTDRIEENIELKAPIERVWRALTDHDEFGTWFRVKLDGPFVPGELSTGYITYPGYEHIKWRAKIERMEPPRYFSFRWHPFAIDPDIDYSQETPTLVEFRLELIPGGTQVTVVEFWLRERAELPARGSVPHEQRRLGHADAEHPRLSRCLSQGPARTTPRRSSQHSATARALRCSRSLLGARRSRSRAFPPTRGSHGKQSPSISACWRRPGSCRAAASVAKASSSSARNG